MTELKIGYHTGTLTLSYKEIMRILKHAQKIRTTNYGEWKIQRMNKNQLPILEGLGLIPKFDDPAPKKRGRPRKS